MLSFSCCIGFFLVTVRIFTFFFDFNSGVVCPINRLGVVDYLPRFLLQVPRRTSLFLWLLLLNPLCLLPYAPRLYNLEVVLFNSLTFFPLKTSPHQPLKGLNYFLYLGIEFLLYMETLRFSYFVCLFLGVFEVWVCVGSLWRPVRHVLFQVLCYLVVKSLTTFFYWLSDLTVSVELIVSSRFRFSFVFCLFRILVTIEYLEGTFLISWKFFLLRLGSSHYVLYYSFP